MNKKFWTRQSVRNEDIIFLHQKGVRIADGLDRKGEKRQQRREERGEPKLRNRTLLKRAGNSIPSFQDEVGYDEWK